VQPKSEQGEKQQRGSSRKSSGEQRQRPEPAQEEEAESPGAAALPHHRPPRGVMLALVDRLDEGLRVVEQGVA
jgi:hypothetical protein